MAPEPYPGLLQALRAAESRFPEVAPAAPWRFPEDHAPHPTAAGELWDLAGWLRDERGREWALHWSLTRLGLWPDRPARASAWATTAIYRGLFTLADAETSSFRERLAREALGVAGYAPAQRRLWLDHWMLTLPAAEPGAFALFATLDRRRLQLSLIARKPPATDTAGPRLRGYQLSRLEVSGRVEDHGAALGVTGTAWLDHAYGRLLPPGGQVALDRLRLQLDDGRELAVIRLRRRAGGAPPVHQGRLIDAEGSTEPLSPADIALEARRYWRSARSGNRYPVAWTLKIESPPLELHLDPLVEDQEVDGALRYWSGAVRIRGRAAGGDPIQGRGFVEIGG